MIFKSRIKQLEEIFLRQFEPIGEQLVYRKQGRGAPIPVSLEEQEEFRVEYRKSTWRMLWAVIAFLIVTSVLGLLMAPEFINEGLGKIAIGFGGAALLMVLSVRNTTAPARALERRSPIGEKLSKKEWRSRHFAAISWLPLTWVFLISAYLFVSVLVGLDFRDWQDYLFAAFVAVFPIQSARALWYKFRSAEKSD